MNKKVFVIILIFFLSGNQARSQMYPRWTTGFFKRLIFLKSVDTLIPALTYYNMYSHRSQSESPSIIDVKGYVIDEYNLKNGNDLTIILKNLWHRELSMTIDLHFAQLPEAVVYYLEIPRFNPGRTIRVIIPNKLRKVTHLEDRRKPYLSIKKDKVTWPNMEAFDITDIVFPEYAGKRNE